jgi:cysteinyl-tRNA synthetase
MQWEYKGRMGYPGWHLECATIIHNILGETIDIHCGGIDHIPVHHTNEIAEIEAAYGNKMSNYWLHNNFAMIEGEKISKSIGNVYMFSDLAKKGYTHMDYKMWVLQGHFQSERNFTFEDLAAAKQRLLNYRNFAALRWQSDNLKDFEDAKKKILEQLNNNLNSAGAFAELDAVVNAGAPSVEFVKFIDDVFGLNIEESTPDISDELKEKIEERFKAKKAKDFAKADALRDEILADGITLLDGAEKSTWQYK